jgi:hypothetical protein
MADDNCNWRADSNRGAPHLASSEPGGRTYSHCKLLHRLVPVFRFATPTEPRAPEFASLWLSSQRQRARPLRIRIRRKCSPTGCRIPRGPRLFFPLVSQQHSRRSLRSLQWFQARDLARHKRPLYRADSLSRGNFRWLRCLGGENEHARPRERLSISRPRNDK